MQTLFSTTNVHPRDAFDYWHEIACKTIVPHDAVPESRFTFRAELKSRLLSDIPLVFFEIEPMTIAHTVKHAARSDPEFLFLCLQFAGSVTIEQQCGQVALEPGDLTLVDPRLPYKCRFEGTSRLFLIKLPRKDLNARLGTTDLLIGRLLRPNQDGVALASAFFAELPRSSEGLTDTAAE